MARKRYWNGFVTGAAVGVGASAAAVLLTNMAGSRGSRIIRLEKSVQVGRPVEEVFRAWSNFDQLARASSVIRSISTAGSRSHWVLEVEGRQIEWDAEVEQFIPNQAIGWKSVNGPKHTGRISFSPLQNDTLITVTMNYAPPMRALRLGPVRERLKQHIEKAIREFKAAMEGKGQGSGATGTHYHTAEPDRATGTFGATTKTQSAQNPRFGTSTNPLEYTKPSEAKP